jgi:hypothetical protein
MGKLINGSGYFGAQKPSEDAEELKTKLPEEDLKESLSNIGSDMVKRVESEPIQGGLVDSREGSDVL